MAVNVLIVASSWSHLYLLFKDARSFEYKVLQKTALFIFRGSNHKFHSLQNGKNSSGASFFFFV